MSSVFDRAFHIYKYWHNKGIEFEHLAPTHTFRSVEEGKIIAVCNGKTITVNKGEALYIPPEIKADIKCFAEPYTHGMVMMLRYFPDADELDYPPQSVKLVPEAIELLNGMPNHNLTNNVTCRTISTVYKIIDLVQNGMKKHEDKRVQKIEKTLDFMRTNSKYSIPQLAAYCGMSERHFYALFKEFTGLTPIQMKHKIQATKAEILLRTTELSIEEIVKQVGLESDSHFRKIFKERYSRLPKSIRKNN